MELLFEIIGEAFFELIFIGGEHAIKCDKLPKPIRYFLATVALLCFLAVIGLLVWFGVSVIIDTSLIGGLAILAVALFLVIAATRKILK